MSFDRHVWRNRRSIVKSDQLIERLAAVFALIVLVGGSLLVLAPFTTALLWGAILSYSSWGLYRRLTGVVGGRRKLAATLIVLIILVVVLGPFVYAGFAFGTHVHEIVALVQRLFESGLPDLPPWVQRIPLVGSSIEAFWERLTSSNSELIAQLRTLARAGWQVDFGGGAGGDAWAGAARAEHRACVLLLYRGRGGGCVAERWHASSRR
ncbi:putative PurR-regulated permease PerM [Paraburkholderia youngii]